MDEQTKKQASVKERLLLAGIDELGRSGIQNFSIRRVAAACGVSCAAPYNHFSDKNDFILAIIAYINGQWVEIQAGIAEKYAGDTRRQLIETSVAYVRFLCKNPYFRSILMQRDDSLAPEQLRAKSQMSPGTKALVDKYCEETKMPPETRVRKTFVVRSLIYGAALMLDNGELENNQESFDFIAQAIAREFDLP